MYQSYQCLHCLARTGKSDRYDLSGVIFHVFTDHLHTDMYLQPVETVELLRVHRDWELTPETKFCRNN